MTPLYTFKEIKQLIPSLNLEKLELLKTVVIDNKTHYPATELNAIMRMLVCRVKYIARFEAKVMSWHLTYRLMQLQIK